MRDGIFLLSIVILASLGTFCNLVLEEYFVGSVLMIMAVLL